MAEDKEKKIKSADEVFADIIDRQEKAAEARAKREEEKEAAAVTVSKSDSEVERLMLLTFPYKDQLDVREKYLKELNVPSVASSDMDDPILGDTPKIGDREDVAKFTLAGRTLKLTYGLHVIVGLPRSGKTTLLKNLMTLCKSDETCLFHLDEPVEESEIGVVKYGPQGFADILQIIHASSKTAFGIDSLRLLMYSMKGSTLKGGLSSAFKEILTLMNNYAIRTKKRIFLVLTTDSDLLLDVRASCSTLWLVENRRFCVQHRDAKKVLDPMNGTSTFDSWCKLMFVALKDTSLSSFELARRAVSGNQKAALACRMGLTPREFELAARRDPWKPIDVGDIWDNPFVPYGEANDIDSDNTFDPTSIEADDAFDSDDE